MDVVEVAKLIRRALKMAFPGTTFSVRSSRFAGGTAISVVWTGTPIEAEVKQLIGRFAGLRYDKRRDGWEPLTYYFRSDGSSMAMGSYYGHQERVSDWTDSVVAALLPSLPAWAWFGADYVSAYREPSEAERAERAEREREIDEKRRADPDGLPF